MKILITGSNGLLGQKIIDQLLKKKINFLATSLGKNRNSNCPSEKYCSLDITNEEEIKSLLDDFQPHSIINTAAMTNVDACETHQKDCQKINIEAVKFIFDECLSRNIHLVHLSTDFVFDGENGPYKEEDERNPLSVYAKSKVDSEDILLSSSYQSWAILRTIIVFGTAQNLSRSNIVLWAKESLENGNTLTIVNDQFRAPTWADDLAWACIATSLGSHKGVYHISGPETFSIYELVCRIAKYYKLDTSLVQAISSNSLNQKAKRPAKTGFDISKARKSLGFKPMILEESLKSLENELR